MKLGGKKLTSFQIIIFGFAGIILVGALLLMLPISARDRNWTQPLTALFTSTSSVCVTGLIVCDTGRYWSVFGQSVILILIQIGGMGVVLAATAIAVFTGRRIGLLQRSLVQNSISSPQVGGIVKLVRFIIRFIVAAEGIGILLLSLVFVPQYGWIRGIRYSIFHSISAFCNAGFDILGSGPDGSSLMKYSGNIIINLTIMGLIIAGGLGFMTWQDLMNKREKRQKLRVQTRLILVMTVILILVPAVFFFIELKDLPFKTRVLGALFQSVTTRTAGFNTLDLTRMPEGGQGVMVFLMLTGAAPGSTAGGMKVTTLAVVILCARSVFRREDEVHCMRHRIDTEIVRYASAVCCLYVGLFFISAVTISEIEGLPLLTCLFETASAIGTVGLTLGITSTLHCVSKVILILLMFFGRVGSLTLIYAFIPEITRSRGHYTAEKIMIG